MFKWILITCQVSILMAEPSCKHHYYHTEFELVNFASHELLSYIINLCTVVHCKYTPTLKVLNGYGTNVLLIAFSVNTGSPWGISTLHWKGFPWPVWRVPLAVPNAESEQTSLNLFLGYPNSWVWYMALQCSGYALGLLHRSRMSGNHSTLFFF